MARSSGGTIPARQAIVDANQATAILDGLHHWQSTRCNSGNRRYYRVTITHAGKRVSGSAVAFVQAVNAALAKLWGGEKVPFMRIAAQPLPARTGGDAVTAKTTAAVLNMDQL